MSEYLPSFIVEPVLRQARRFSERIGGEESPAGAVGSSFTLPAVPDLQRFYPTRFWSQSPSPAVTSGVEDLTNATLDHDNVEAESTLRSIARNIQLWANQINNLDDDDEVVQEPVLPSIEQNDMATTVPDAVVVEEPEDLIPEHGDTVQPTPADTQRVGSRSLPFLDQLRQPQRTSSETSINPAHELSYQSRIRERNEQGRSHSDPLAAVSVPEPTNIEARQVFREENGMNGLVRISDGTTVLPEDDGMRPLRQKINAVWAGPGTSHEKSKLVHSLMNERYHSTQRIATPTSSATATSPPFRATSPLSLASFRSEEAVFNLSPSDIQPTYAPLDPSDAVDDVTGEIQKPDLGCLHYKRNVKMQCAVCERWYPCRICHDEVEDHELPRRETRHMLCMVCHTPQRASQICRVCHVQAACYYCSICKLWNNDANKSIYHCDDCGICRLGQGLGKDFFHCKTCAACMSIAAESTHKCIEKSTKCDCPICGEFMFTSSLPVTFMRCGHSIHDACFAEWCNTSYKCPICSKSIANMESQFRRLDRHIENQPMPEEYSLNRAYVFCNDCNSRSVVKYHWLGLKCAVCDSYNTAQLEILGAESPAIQERADRAQELGVGEAGMTASQSQTPTEELISPSSRSATAIGQTLSRSIPSGPARRDSPFHNLPHSPSRSVRARSPVIGSYFGTGQRPSPVENRRGSYFSVLSFGATSDEHLPSHPRQSLTRTQSGSSQQRQSSRLSQSHLMPSGALAIPAAEATTLHRGTSPLEDDDNMDFWGGQSPRSYDADIVVADVAGDEEEEESSSDEDDEMDYEDGDEDEEDDPMDILIGHR